MQSKSNAKKRETTIAKQLAEELGVSVSTISRAFSPRAVIASETREKVLQRAKELGYQPNPFARSLITRKTNIASIIVSDITNPFYPEVLTRLTDSLQGIGLNVMLFVSTNAHDSDNIVSQALRYQPDVLIALAATVSSKAALKVTEAGTSMVYFNRYVPNESVYTVTCDNYLGGQVIADLFFDNGCRYPAFISGLADATTNRERWKGFSERWLERAVSEPCKVEAGRFAHEAGFNATIKLLAGRVRPDAIFAANDLLALGALDAVKKAGLSAPKDVSIIGFDDIAMASWSSHSLTTYRQPVNKMITATVDIVKSILADKAQPPAAIHIPGELVLRSSAKIGNMGCG